VGLLVLSVDLVGEKGRQVEKLSRLLLITQHGSQLRCSILAATGVAVLRL
jgi:hypothetical protein